MDGRFAMMRCFWFLVAIAPLLSISMAGCEGETSPLENQSTSPSTAPIVKKTPEPAPPPLIEATLAGDLASVRFPYGEATPPQLQSGTDSNQVYRTNTALTYAARDGFTDIARALIDAGADVNWIDGEGVTPLILASFKGHTEIVQILLDQGADTTIKDQWNRTALDYALRRGNSDPIAQLLQQSR